MLHSWGGGGGGRESHIKKTGCSSEILKRTPKKYQDPVLWLWLVMFFSPKRYQVLHLITHYFLSYFVSARSLPKRYHKSSTCGPFEA